MARAHLVPLTMIPLIAIAMVMLASAMLMPMSIPMPMSDAAALSGPGGDDVVMQFYAAVNETIATGDPAALRRVLNPSFADENPLPGVSPGRAGLEDYLATLHATEPGLRLEAEILSASTEQVVARVQVRRMPTSASFPATAGEERAVWSPVEAFRIANDVIVGRWGHTDELTLTRSLALHQLVLASPTSRIVSLMRVTQAPGTRWDAPRVAGPRLLYVEEGVLDVQVMAEPVWEGARGAGSSIVASVARHAEANHRVVLTTGMSWQAPAGTFVSTTSTGSTEARMVIVTFSEPKIPQDDTVTAAPLASGVTAQILAGNLATSLGPGPVTVRLERLTFAAHAGLNLWSTQGPLLVAVERGNVKATVSGTAWVRRNRDGMSASTRLANLTTEQGLLLQPDGVVALHNGEQNLGQALVVTIQHDAR